MESAQRTVGKSSCPKPICTNCKRSGHSTENCYAKGGAKEGQAPWKKKKEEKKDSQKADSANTVTELPDTAYALTSESTSEPPSEVWVSDTGAPIYATIANVSPLLEPKTSMYAH